jgi:SAM-dependent methyltransferase
MPSESKPNRNAVAESGCEVCGGGELRRAFDSSRGRVLRCRACGVYCLAADSPVPVDQASLFYSAVDEASYVTYFEPFRKGQYRATLQGLDLGSKRSLLDIGSSYGWMVEVGLGLGLDSFGVEPGAAHCDPNIASRVYRGSLADYAQNETRCFDVVTIWHVLEHLREPVATMQALRRLLCDDGYLVIAVPTTDGRLFRLALMLERFLGRGELLAELFYFHNPNMHFFYYNAGALTALLRLCGLRPESVYTIESFDWRTIYQRAGNPVARTALRLAGPFLALSRLTRGENLIVIARKAIEGYNSPTGRPRSAQPR